MKQYSKLLKALSVAIIVLPLWVGVMSADWIPPADDKQLVGDWIGYQSDGLYFYRLALNRDGGGACVSVYQPDKSSDAYAVDPWRINGETLLINMSHLTGAGEGIAVSVSTWNNLQMELIIKGMTDNWQRKAILYKESEFVKVMEISAKHKRRMR